MTSIPIDITNIIDTVTFSPPISPVSPHKTAWEKITTTAQKIATFIENIIWKYVKETNNIIKRIIKTVVLTCAEIPSLNSVITKLGILSSLSVLFALKSIANAGMSLEEHIKLKDGEGIAFSTLSLVVNPLDALDSIITTTEALTAFELIPQIAFFSMIALPLAIGLIGYAAIKGLYDLIRCSLNYHALPKFLENHNLEDFKTYIKTKLGVTKEEKDELQETLKLKRNSLTEVEYDALRRKEIQIIKDRKRNILTRHTDAKVYNIMLNLKKYLKSKSLDLTANLALNDMKTIMVRKIIWGSFSVGANVAFGVTLACSAIFPISIFAAPLVAGVRALLSLGKHHYDHTWLDYGLNRPEFLKL